jgi:hypothetical protein
MEQFFFIHFTFTPSTLPSVFSMHPRTIALGMNAKELLSHRNHKASTIHIVDC